MNETLIPGELASETYMKMRLWRYPDGQVIVSGYIHEAENVNDFSMVIPYNIGVREALLALADYLEAAGLDPLEVQMTLPMFRQTKFTVSDSDGQELEHFGPR